MNVSVAPSRSTTTPVTAFPSRFVSSLEAFAFVNSVTFSYLSAGRTPSTSASALACSGQGKPSQLAQRTQVLYGGFCSSSRIPHGAWKGWYPAAASWSESCWIRGSCDTAGWGYGALAGGSVGSSPLAPCTWYICSALV